MGYRNQATMLARHLQKKGHEIFYMANGYSGSNLENLKLEGGEEFNYKIYGHSQNNPYFSQTMSKTLKEIKADRFIILLDTFMLFQTNFLNADTSPAKTFFWFPSDGGGGLPKNCENVLKKIDVPVSMSEFGQKQVKDYYGLSTKFIPHGVDPKSFYPLSQNEKKELRKMNGFEDKFVIGVVARNQPRKHMDRVIKTMSLVAKKIPNAVLYLHLDPQDPAQSLYSIPEIVKKHGIENRVIYSGMSAFSGFPQSQMNKVYNLMDIFLLTTSGEGFGIPIIEAMACKIPVVCTDYTTTQELIKDNKSGLGIRLSGVKELDLFANDSKEYDKLCLPGTMTGSWEVERGICDINHAASQIEYLYKHPKTKEMLGENGRKAVMEKYDFEIIGKQWEAILK